VGVTDGEVEGGGVSAGVAGGVAGADATTVAARDGEGDGAEATRMPHPASSVAAPAAASTLARHLGLTSASSILAPMFAAARDIPSPQSRCRLPHTGRSRRRGTMDDSTRTGHARRDRHDHEIAS
jgi:hypothetical protein